MQTEKKLTLNQQTLRHLNLVDRNPRFIPITTSCIISCICTPPGSGPVR